MKAFRLNRLPRIVLSGALIAGLQALCLRLPHVNDTAVALLLVLAITGIAATLGWTASLVAAVIAGLGFDYYFLAQQYGFAVESPEDWVALAAFVATALIASWLFTLATRGRIQAGQQRDDMEKLYRVVNALLDVGSAESALGQLASQVVEILEADGVALYNKHARKIFRSGTGAPAISDDALREAAMPGDQPKNGVPFVSLAAIQHDDEVFGSIGVSGVALSPSLLDAVTGRLGMGLAKLYATERLREAEAVRRSEELKSAVLDALAHEIKNPLNSIKIAVTTLLSGRLSAELPKQSLLTIIDEETSRMSRCIDEAVQLARVEADKLTLKKEPQNLNDLVPAAIQELGLMNGDRTIQVSIPASLPPAKCDKEMMTRVLKQLITNALKYSPEHSPLTVSAELTSTAIVVNVIDCGPGVAENEKDRIFEKYYRGRAAASGAPGTGLGLASAKVIVQAHGGEIWVTSPPAGGAAFHVSLPMAGKAN